MTVLDFAAITTAGLAVIVGPPSIDPAAAHELAVIDETRPEIAKLEADLDRRGWLMNDTGTWLAWRLDRARMDVHIAEERLLDLYGAQRRSAEPETYTCESCPASDPDLFTLLEAGETDGDQLCDDCHREQAALRASDERHRLTYLYG